MGMTSCDENADCVDNVGSYECVCRTGYTGNGLSSCIGSIPKSVVLYLALLVTCMHDEQMLMNVLNQQQHIVWNMHTAITLMGVTCAPVMLATVEMDSTIASVQHIC